MSLEHKISIIIPIYNTEKFLNRCMESVLKQSYTNLEIILVNDGSIDNSPKICEDYAKQDDRIKVVHRKNGGLSAARNSGLKIFTGDYVVFVDSDDWINPSMIKNLYDLIIENNCDLAISDVIKSNNLDSLSSSKNLDKPVLLNKKELLLNYLKDGFYVVRNLYSKKTINNLFFREDIKVTEDVFFGMDIVEKVNNAIYINEKNYIYFVDNTESLTRSPYDKGHFDSINANLYIQNKTKDIFENDIEIKTIIRKRILKNAYYHYYQIHYNNPSFLDEDYNFRKKIKKIINSNFSWKDQHSLFNMAARIFNVKTFEFINRLKTK